MRLHDAGEVLAIEPETYRRWLARLEGAQLPDLVALDSPEAAAKLVPGRKSIGDIAVLRLSGFLTQKPNLFTMLFGGTSMEAFAREVVAALNDSTIGSVIMDVDSPGGSAMGPAEAAAMIRRAKGSKPLVAVANPLTASAAYWIASQADEVVAAPSSLVGSIGAITIHVDESAALEKMGLKVTEITSSRRKAEESSLKPLTDEAWQAIKTRIDYFGRLFEADVAKGRKVGVEAVRSRFGEGAVMVPPAAKAAGLVDRVATLDEVIWDLARGKRPDPAARSYDPGLLTAHAILAGVDLDEKEA